MSSTVLGAVLGARAIVAREVRPTGERPSFNVPDKDSPELAWWRDSMQAHDQRIQWWRDARFGMFIHWGVYSTLGGTWNGQPVTGYAEHIQRKLKIPISEYREKVAGSFNPVKFNADEWARFAKDAGMGYIVITSKHHDGFAMFDSQVSDYNVVKATPWHQDPMKLLKAACEKQGIKLGFYYSQAFDWGEADGAGNDWNYDNPAGDKLLHGGRTWWESSPQLTEKTQKYVDHKAIPQLRELIAKYDPALIWFDTPSKLPPSQNLQIFKATREAGPNVVLNSRCVGQLADYSSTTDRPAEFPPHDGDWEGIPTTNESYGYNQNDHSQKPASHFIQLLAKAAARGGNLMLNFGPRGDGTLDPADVAILEGIAAWMKVNGDSIHGTTRTPLAVQSWGESTRKGNTLYLHVFDWPKDGKIVVGGLKSNVTKAYLLSDASKTGLKTSRLSPLDVEIACSVSAPDATDSVVVLECESADAISCDADRLLAPNMKNALRSFDAKLEGKTIRFGPGKKENAYVERWTSPDDSVLWNVRVANPTTFEAAVIYDAPASSAGGSFLLSLDDSPGVTGNVREGKEIDQPAGRLTLSPGSHVIRIKPEKIAGTELMQLRTLTLTPVVK